MPVSDKAFSPSTAIWASGYVQQWNVGVQRAITNNLVFEIAYAGSKITHVGIPDIEHQSAYRRRSSPSDPRF